MRKVYKFRSRWQRTETITGVFVADDADVEAAIGIEGRLDDPCGRHSSGPFTLAREHLTVLTDDQAFIDKAIAFNLVPVGVNPLYALKCQGTCGDVLDAPYVACRHKDCGWVKGAPCTDPAARMHDLPPGGAE